MSGGPTDLGRGSKPINRKRRRTAKRTAKKSSSFVAQLKESFLPTHERIQAQQRRKRSK